MRYDSLNTALSKNLTEFIERGKSIELKYNSFSMYNKDNNENILTVYNVLDDYKDDILEYVMDIYLEDDEVTKYQYNPKRLSYDLYGATDFYPFILWINDMGNIKEFDLLSKKLKLFPKESLSKILGYIYDAEHNKITNYNYMMDIKL